MSQFEDKLSRLDGVIGRLETLLGEAGVPGSAASGGAAALSADVEERVQALVERLDDTIQRLRAVLES